MTAKPKRIRLSRAKSWRMPENTVKVDRTTKWGNPFIVGKDGTAAECVDLYSVLTARMFAFGCTASIEEQQAAYGHIAANLASLRGKNLACWCAADKPCHADVLLALANRRKGSKAVPGIVAKALRKLKGIGG